MRLRTVLQRSVVLAMIAGLTLTASTAQAKNEFDALLADVNFGEAVQQVKESTSESASDAAHFASLPQPQGAALPQAMGLPKTAKSTGHHQVISGAEGCSDAGCASGGCASGNCNSGSCLDGHCTPYTPPRLPHSSFYQMWRTNPCNVNVWDGYRNKCKPNIDLSIHKRSRAKCSSGSCEVYPAGTADCGPAPAEWCDSGTCD